MSETSTTPAAPTTSATGHTVNRNAGSRLRIGVALLCLLLSAALRQGVHIDTWGEDYRVKDSNAIVGGQWMSGMLLGFREAVADLMWIRVDQYFHEGRYDKIMPICYVITAMDPGWIDVYTTGAWHLGYNFGDRRLVQAAIDFDQRGATNNPDNYDMAYELGWMQESRGYDFVDAAKNFQRAIQLELRPVGKTHAWPHALESAGDIDGAIAAWKYLKKADPTDRVPDKWIFMLNMRKEARKDLASRPINVKMWIKLVKKGPRVLELQGVTNLPRYSRIYFDLRDSDWAELTAQHTAQVWQMGHATVYSQKETTLQPEMGIFDGETVDFYQGQLKVHQDDKQYDAFPTEPDLPVVGGHMVMANGSFHTTIDMAKIPEQYPLESPSYTLKLFVDPRREPITTQDVLGWNGEGLSGPLVTKENGYNQLVWTMKLKKSDIE